MWITIFTNRFWKEPISINEDKILRLVFWRELGEIEIIYPNGLFTKSFWLKEDKDHEEYKYFLNKIKQGEK
jgi:hypothetical protein